MTIVKDTEYLSFVFSDRNMQRLNVQFDFKPVIRDRFKWKCRLWGMDLYRSLGHSSIRFHVLLGHPVPIMFCLNSGQEGLAADTVSLVWGRKVSRFSPIMHEHWIPLVGDNETDKWEKGKLKEKK